MSKHLKVKHTRNGGMRFLAVDVFGQRVQLSFCKVKKSQTVAIDLLKVATPVRIIACAMAIMHVGASLI